MKAKSKTEQL